ncbi:MAG: hypothetical protein KIT11_04045 [Fimbriimonadaceae bacterium]|nr:hypothetical protein [Fimbriimonadaceae bacterium]QYK56932.1 MAG: hypothetical protein KF733_05480 [Fimbriimonadaceae bacterium]
MVGCLVAWTLLATPGSYRLEEIEGWDVRFDLGIAQASPETWMRARKELATQLYRVSRVVPEPHLSRLREVIVWVNDGNKHTACMAYHPGADWLVQHGLNPEMEKGVEVGNLQTFIDWTQQQPWMVLHELAHAYHDRFLDSGFENPQVLVAYQSAVAAKKYESVLHWDGKNVRHYALTNQMEYFAEATEAFFGQNDFYPFTKPELATFDPKGYSLMQSVWAQKS